MMNPLRRFAASPQPLIRRLVGIAVLAAALCAVSVGIMETAHADPTDEDPPVVSQSDDLDGDDVADTVTADPEGGEAASGTVGISSGSDGSSISTIEGQPGGKFGESVTASWDTNGDGFKDLIIGAPLEGTGRIYVYDGPFSASLDASLTADDASMEIIAPDADVFEFGYYVGGIPDVDGDGIADMLTRARFVDSDGRIRTRHYVLSGFDAALIQSTDVQQPTAADDQGGGAATSGSGGCDCPADIAGPDGQGPDGTVDVFDQFALQAAWGACPEPCPPSCPADLAEPFCVVDVFDLFVLLNSWGDCDSDGDGLPDWWENRYGLNPCHLDPDDDMDNDGLSNLEEYQLGTDGDDPDTDQDGVSDGAEVIAGADPNAPEDGGVGPNSDNVLYVMLTFGDQSCHNSELWHMRFGGNMYENQPAIAAGCQEPPDMPQHCDAPWSCPEQAPYDAGPIPIERGKAYDIEMVYSHTAYLFFGSDYDWTCKVDLCDSSGGNRQPLVEFVENDPGTFDDDEWLPAAPAEGVFIHDPDELMGQRWTQESSDPTAGKSATLVAVAPQWTVDVVNQDVPTSTLFEAADEDIPIVYGGSESSTSDDVRLIVSVEPPIATILAETYSWSVTGPGASQYMAPPPQPTIGSWMVGDIHPIQGILTFNGQVEFPSGLATFSKQIEVGIRTDDVALVGWINPAGVSMPSPPPLGLTPQLLILFPAAGPSPSPSLAAEYVIQLSECSTSPNGFPLTADDRQWVLLWMFKNGGNADPTSTIPGGDFRNADNTAIDINEVNDFLATPTLYKLVNRLQLKYTIPSGGSPNPSILRSETTIGTTINPLGSAPGAPDLLPGQIGPNNGLAVMSTSPLRFSQVNDGSPDAAGIRAFNTLTSVGVPSPLFWENIGSQIRFLLDGQSTDPTIIVQPYPTYYEYRNGTLVNTYPQAASPILNFVGNPYPFGLIPCIGTFGTQPGGRCGDASSPPAISAGTPAYIVP